MSLFSPLLNVFGWFKRTFIDHIKSTAIVAVTITETLKTLLNNPVTGFLLNLADGITHTSLPTDVAGVVNNAIPKILAVELSIEGLPDNPTPDQILAFENSVLKAFNINNDNSKLYTTFGAQLFGIIQSKLADGKLTFAEGVEAVQSGWNDYQNDLITNGVGIVDLPVGTVLANGNVVLETANQAIKENLPPN